MSCGNASAVELAFLSASNWKVCWLIMQTSSLPIMRNAHGRILCSTLLTMVMLHLSACALAVYHCPYSWRGRESERDGRCRRYPAFWQPVGSTCCPRCGKKNGEWRFCVDYRHLNAVTHKDFYTVPCIDEARDHIVWSSWFSSMGLRSGYWQVGMAQSTKTKTAFTIGQGLWQFRVMLFGLCNPPATFEWLMERVLLAVPRSCCVVYLDDLLVHASSFEHNLANLCNVFSEVRLPGLWFNLKKCQLFQRETAFLRHIVKGQEVSTDSAKVADVKDWPCELHSFLGLASYYRRFIRDFHSQPPPAPHKQRLAVPAQDGPHSIARVDLPRHLPTLHCGHRHQQHRSQGRAVTGGRQWREGNHLLQTYPEPRWTELLRHSTQTAGRCARPPPLLALPIGRLLLPTHRQCLPHLAVEL